MLAVLMSMKPEWWEKILDGEKTLEIRKTHPQNERLEWPVTVLVYVSGTGAVQGQFLCPALWQSSAWTVRPCRGSMWKSRTRRRNRKCLLSWTNLAHGRL